MRDGALFGRQSPRRAKGFKAIALAFTTCWGMGVAGAQGQQPGYPVAPPSDPQVQQVAATSDQARFDELQNQIRQLQAQLNGMQAAQGPSQGGVQATPTGYVANAEAADNAALADGSIKEVPLYTGPKFGDIKVGVKVFFDNIQFNQSAANLAAVRNSIAPTVAQPTFNSTARELDFTGMPFLRLYAQGKLYENVDFKFEIDTAANALVPTNNPVSVVNPTAPSVTPNSFNNKAIFETIQLKDIYSTVKLLPYIGNVRIGHFKEPFCLDELIGDEDATFERRSIVDSFAPARKWGIMAFNYVNDNRDLSVYSGIFRDASNDQSFAERSDVNDYAFTSRLVWLPFYDEPSEGRYLLHTGVGYRYVGAPDSLTNTEASPSFKAFTVTPEASSLNPFLTTGNIACDHYQEVDPELAAIWGPLSFQSEANWTTFQGNGKNGSFADRNIYSFYAQAAYVLTGENRSYDREAKKFGSVTPYEPFFRVNTCDGVCMGKGAWEVAARYSLADLDGAFGSPINPTGTAGGGQIHDTTFALNWYLNQYTRVWFDYVHSDVEGQTAAGAVAKGSADIYETRFSVAY